MNDYTITFFRVHRRFADAMALRGVEVAVDEWSNRDAMFFQPPHSTYHLFINGVPHASIHYPGKLATTETIVRFLRAHGIAPEQKVRVYTKARNQ